MAYFVFPQVMERLHHAMSTSKKAKHTVDKLAGRVKENLGDITGNDRLRTEGKVDQVKARVKQSGERLKDAVRGR